MDAIENPSSADIARKVKIEQALAEAQRKEAGPDVLLIRNATGNLPWDKAAGSFYDVRMNQSNHVLALRPSMDASSDGTCSSVSFNSRLRGPETDSISRHGLYWKHMR